jgi:myo-inositol-1(or 4)-monophosphatase
MNIEKITANICEVARNTGHFVKDNVNKLDSDDIQSKSAHDFVTRIDKSSEEKIIKQLSLVLPEAGFIAEESTQLKTADEYNWVVDPIDGTTNFIHGIPCYSISIALMQNGKVISGVVYEINMDECFYSFGEGSSFLNGKIIKVSTAPKLSDSLVATGFPNVNYSFIEEYFNVLKELMFTTHGIRRLGSAAVDLAYVACGRFEAFYEYNLNPWDVAAGAFIVEQAGGKMTDFIGGDNYIFGKELISSNALVHDEIVNIIKKHFKNDK